MKAIKSTVLAILTAAALGAAVPAPAEDLAAIYQRALRSDPQLREAEATRLATLERRPQALSSLLPQLNANGQWLKDESTAEATVSVVDPNTGAVCFRPLSTETDGTQTTWNVQLRQTLFRWDQFARYRSAGFEVAQAEIDFRNAQQDVIVRAATAYFNVLAA